MKIKRIVSYALAVSLSSNYIGSEISKELIKEKLENCISMTPIEARILTRQEVRSEEKSLASYILFYPGELIGTYLPIQGVDSRSRIYAEIKR